VRTNGRSRSLRLVLVALLLALLAGACAGDGEIGSPTLGGTPAAKVGDFEITNADLRDDVERWAANAEMLQAIGVRDLGAAGRRSAQLVAFVLSHEIVSEQARLMLRDVRAKADSGEIDLAELGIDGEALGDPGDDEIRTMLDELDQGFSGPDGRSLFAEFSDDFRRQLAIDLLYQDRLGVVMQAGIPAPEVEVNPRYGTVELVQGGIAQVRPPSGPRPAPIGGADLGA